MQKELDERRWWKILLPSQSIVTYVLSLQYWYNSGIQFSTIHEYLVFKNNLHRLHLSVSKKGDNYEHATVKKRTLGLLGRMWVAIAVPAAVAAVAAAATAAEGNGTVALEGSELRSANWAYNNKNKQLHISRAVLVSHRLHITCRCVFFQNTTRSSFVLQSRRTHLSTTIYTLSLRRYPNEYTSYLKRGCMLLYIIDQCQLSLYSRLYR